MKISILGSNGFLSTAIGRYYQHKSCQLDMYGLDEPLYHTFSNFFKTDLSNEFIDVKSMENSDVVIYAIGAGVQANRNDEANLIYQLNVTAPISICNQLKEIGFKGIFVSFGSYFEMGPTTLRRPFTEIELLSSISLAPNNYTVSKRLFSRFVSSYLHEYQHWHFILPTIYGKGENPQRLIPYTINAIKRQSKYFFTSGNQIREYIHVNDIPPIIDLAIGKRIPSGVYNIGGHETLTIHQLVSLIHKTLGCKIPDSCFNKIQRADEGMHYLALDGSKLNTIIPYTPSIDIKSSIPDYL